MLVNRECFVGFASIDGDDSKWVWRRWTIGVDRGNKMSISLSVLERSHICQSTYSIAPFGMTGLAKPDLRSPALAAFCTPGRCGSTRPEGFSSLSITECA